jgi:translation initiation factor 2 subunit 3
MIVIRSFDVNKPGEDAENLKGGVAGGTILKGVFKIGDEVEIRPGIIRRDSKSGQVSSTALFSKVTSLKADENHLMYAVPGGLIGVGLKVDPFITRSDRLVGQIIGHPGKMPEVVVEIDA